MPSHVRLPRKSAPVSVFRKTTAWYPGTIKPVHPGFYEVKGPMIETGLLLHWNGRYWGTWHPFAFGSGHHYIDHGFGSQKGDAWRGLLQK